MHELAIVEGILDAVIPEVKKYNVKNVLSIKLKIGELSGVVPESVQYYFDIAARDTLASGARLIMERIPATIGCPDCGYSGPIVKGRYACPRCGSTGFKLISGREYYVDSVEAE